MQKYQNNVQTLDGRAIVGAQVTVTTYPGGAPATVYNANGSGVIAQPILTNGDGEFAFYAANGRYQLSITGGGISIAQNVQDISLFDPAETNAVPSSSVAFTQSGSGAVSRDIQSKARETVSPEDFGAVGDNITDDATAFAKALATGKSVICGPKTYFLGSGITLATAGQRLLGNGPGTTLLRFSGNFNCITISTSGGTGGGIEDIKIDASSMAGGYTIAANFATRIDIRNVRGITGFNGISLVRVNTVAIEQCSFEGYRGTKMVYCDGTAQRSDIVRVVGLTIKGDGIAFPDGFVVDGNFNTIQSFGMIVLSCNRAIWHCNTAATTPGQFARYYDFEGDLTNTGEQIRLDSGSDIHFTDLYAHGSTGADGVFIASGVDTVSLKGGKVTGNFKCGVNNNGTRVKIVGTLVGGNSQQGTAAFSGVLCGATAEKFTAIGCETGLNVGGIARQKYGFEVASGASDCNWIGGSLRDNATGEWLDASGGASGNVNVIGYGGSSASSLNAYLAIVPSNGGSTTIANNQKSLYLTSAGTTTSYTVTMPPNPIDGDVYSISSRGIVTTFTLNANAGQTMNNAPTTLAAGEGHAWIWRASSSNWFKKY